jgi:hypothetical protein
MSFDPIIFQKIMSMNPGRTHTFGFVVTGDDDSTDCLHEPISFTATVTYAP